MPTAKTGTVKFLHHKGFGFITADDGLADVFFHENQVDGEKPVASDRVEFTARQDRRGRRLADSVRVL